MPKVKVILAGHVAGLPRKVGEVLDLTDRQVSTGLRRGRVELLKDGPKSSDLVPGTPAAMSAVEIRAKLDELKVSYPANANKATLVELLTAAQVVLPDPLA